MKKGDIAKMESIHSKLLVVLEKYRGLVDEGCINGCKECLLGKIVIPKRGFPYEYAEGKLYGPLTVCDFLGILMEET